jgi:hypothetical protein
VIEDRVIRKMISVVLAMLMPAAFGQESVASKINKIHKDRDPPEK